MTDTTTPLNGQVPAKPYFAIYKNPNTAKLYDNDPKRFMYIDACVICRHRIEGAEDGGGLFDPNHEGIEEDLKWYYCTHPDFTGWPKRIGQLNKCKEIPYFCPLESLTKVDDSLVRVDDEKPKKKEKKTKNDPETSTTQNPLSGTTPSVPSETTTKL